MADVSGKGEEKVAGDEKNKGKPTEVTDRDTLKGSVKTDGPRDKKKVGVEQDTKKPGKGAVDLSDNVTPAVTTGHTTDPSVVADAAPTLYKENDTAKEKIDPTMKAKTESTIGAKTAQPKEESKEKTELDEGDIATPKLATKELPATPEKSLKEKAVPVLGLVVPKTPKNRSALVSAATVTGAELSPLQKVLQNTQDETLMERMARLIPGDTNYQPPKEMVPPAPTDLDSEFDTAPTGFSTPRSRAGRESFNLILGSDVPLSDDDEFFAECDNVSMSNFDGI